MFCARRAGIPRWLQAHVPRRWRETSGFSLLGTQSSAEIPLPLQCVILGPLRSTCQALTPRPSGQGCPELAAQTGSGSLASAGITHLKSHSK